MSSAGSNIKNTLIFRNYAANYGGGIYANSPSGSELIHVTLYNNTSGDDGHELYKTGTSSTGLTLANCIIWNEKKTDVVTGKEFTATYSIIKETSGYVDNGNVSNDDPNLGFQGLLTKASHRAINNGMSTNIAVDIHGENRSNGGRSDIGADEWVDSDDDGLPDWLEALGVTEPLEDRDGDKLENRFEYKNDTNPLAADSDGDELTDGQGVQRI